MDKDVMEDAVTCSICSEEYKSGKHDPLIFPCGHTFCRQCIEGVKKTKNIACPTCREPCDESKINELAMNYSILSLSENLTHFKPQTCKSHGKLLDLWCNHCRVIVCGLCIAHDHRQDVHDIISAQDHMSSLKLSVKNQQATLNEMIFIRKIGIINQTKQLLLSLLKAVKDHKILHCQTNTTKVACEEAYRTTNLESLELLQAKINSLQTCIANSIEQENAPNDREDLSCKTSDANMDSKNKAKSLLSLPGLSPQIFPYPLHVCIVNNARSFAKLTWEDNKFILSSFQDEPVNTHITLQWPTLSVLLSEKTPHAFMDLAIGQQYLGRVYIEVWGHLKRSQHFLVLCLGLQGPCYKGGTFRSSHKDDFKERICGCYYKGLDGTFSTKGIMENLEWDGEYAGKSYEGLVVGTSGGRSDMDALFSIYTKVKSRATCFCPFGEVVSGLDVVKQALMHDPVSDVSIKGCGIVIPSSLLK